MGLRVGRRGFGAVEGAVGADSEQGARGGHGEVSPGGRRVRDKLGEEIVDSGECKGELVGDGAGCGAEAAGEGDQGDDAGGVDGEVEVDAVGDGENGGGGGGGVRGGGG